MNFYPDSSFFANNPGKTLPTPAEIRAMSPGSNHYRPSPVTIPALGLFVKYGADVKRIEVDTQIFVREKLQGIVPVPEVFGWAQDGGQVFIYMALVDGVTLQERWTELDEAERESVCAELKVMVRAWRGLRSDADEAYIGGVGSQPLNEIFLANHPDLTGPFQGPDAIQRFHQGCGINISAQTAVAVAFTHDDLVAPNIILSRGSHPNVIAIIDWAQAGWYPTYWECCKAKQVNLDPQRFSTELQEEWRERYLPMILDPVDDESCFHPWVYFVLSKGI